MPVQHVGVRAQPLLEISNVGSSSKLTDGCQLSCIVVTEVPCGATGAPGTDEERAERLARMMSAQCTLEPPEVVGLRTVRCKIC